MKNLCGIFEHERMALIAVLERDIENESGKAHKNAVLADYHLHNVHMSKRLLSLINNGGSKKHNESN
jgi:hypothetical protein